MGEWKFKLIIRCIIHFQHLNSILIKLKHVSKLIYKKKVREKTWEFTVLICKTVLLQVAAIFNCIWTKKENFCTSDKTITSIVTSTVFALVAQIERELISLRTKEALHAKQLNGLKLGRPQGKGKSKLDEHKDTIIKLLDCGVPKTVIAKQFKTSTVNLYKFLNNVA